MRANYPKFSPSGEKILFIAHKRSITDLYIMDADGQNIEKLTSNTFDAQIITPCWSPNGEEVAFAESGPDGNLDLYTMLIETGKKPK